MFKKSFGFSLGENKPCGSTPISRLTTHFRLMRDQKNCVIPLTETEFELLIVALDYFKLILARIDFPLSEKGADIVDSLSYHLKDYYNTFIR